MSGSSRKLKLSRVRVAFQVLLHVIIIGHLAGYYLLGLDAVGGIDFQDFFHSFVGHGIVTFAVIFTVVIYLSSVIFGRLFCSWGCHFGATQDLAAWILRRIGWRPPVVRTRFLHWCPFLVLVFVFVWPSLERAIDRGGWELQAIGRESLAGGAPWERLPGWFLSVVTFAACGAGILLLLGTRGFCRFVCPYGALFRVTSGAAPWRVRRVAACSGGCSTGPAPPPCTRACPTAIDVHAETERHGRVRSVDCVHCHLCVEACPGEALAYGRSSRGFRPLPVLPATARSGAAVATGSGPRYFLGIWEEALVLAVALVSFAAADLVYGGHFLAATLALGEGLLVAGILKLLRSREARWAGLKLRRNGRFTFGGITACGVFLFTALALLQAAAFKVCYHRGLALREQALAIPSAAGAEAGRGIPAVPAATAAKEGETLEVGAGIGPGRSDAAVVDPPASPVPGERRELLRRSARYLRTALACFPSRTEAREALVALYQDLGDPRAVGEAEELVRRRPRSVGALEVFRRVLLRFGKPDRAEWVAARIRALEGE